MFMFLVLCVNLVVAEYAPPFALPERIYQHGIVPTVGTQYVSTYNPLDTIVTSGAANERGVIPYAPNERVVIPYAPNEKVVIPYAPNERVMLPYAPNEIVVTPYAPNEIVVTPYAPIEKVVTPYAPNERVVIPYDPNERVVMPYASNEKVVMPYAPNEKVLIPYAPTYGPHENVVALYNGHSYAPHGAMHQYGIVPRVIDIAPPRTLTITYQKRLGVNYGNVLSIQQVSEIPKVSWDADKHSLYTLIMIDPLYLVNLQNYEYLHWIVGNIPGNQLYHGEVVTTYQGANPPSDTGLHKYVFLLFKQKGRIHYKRIVKRQPFSVRNFAEYFHLGQPIAGNFFQAQHNGYVY